MSKMKLLIKEKEVTLEEILTYLQKKFNKEIIIETIRAKRYS